MGDACFEEDGSYTINIPEDNPFFPYEVQFTYNGETTNQWFMSPEDSVEIGGHTFYVSAYFDNTAITQMSLKVSDRTIVVYPERKEFVDGDGAMPASLLPLEEEWLNVDLSAYTPAELTMVSVDSIFAGDKALKDSDKIVWTYNYDDDYTVSSSGDFLDLSYHTYYSSSNMWEMIVGDADQLAAGNKRYFVNVKVKESRSWLTPTVYIQDADGKRTNIRVTRNDYDDYDEEDGRKLYVSVPSEEMGSEQKAYLGLNINSSVFADVNFSYAKVYEGKFTSAAEAASGTDITDEVWNQDMSKADAGYTVTRYKNQWFTIVTYDGSGNVTGCLPVYMRFSASGDYFSNSMYERSESGSNWVNETSTGSFKNGCYEITTTLRSGYAANQKYYLTLQYYEGGAESSSAVTAAYAGKYSSIAEASAAGAEDIKEALFNGSYNTGGYLEDYSEGVYFTVFIGNDNDSKQKVYPCLIKAKEGIKENVGPSSGTLVSFDGFYDKNGEYVKSYQVDAREDSYAEYNYLTILVGKNVDLSELAPIFYTDKGIHLYTPGSSSPEISGKSVHDFSNGPVQYTAAAEDGTNSKNYWVQVVKTTDGAGWLYMNSLADEDSDTKTENGIIYSTREILLDGYHNNVHDILLANMGTEAISALSVDLVSDSVELDKYWTLSGDYDLSGCTTLKTTASHGELPNLAKIRIKAKDGITGTADGVLTIKSGNKTLMILTLTGSVGDPSIITKEIPQAVKYVPYGTMIQNSNKYSWNTVSYRLVSGKLPAGMEIKANGEIYGVPRETGKFTFTVMMENGYNNFASSTMTYTLTVLENTDPNVESATDTGYDLTERIQNVTPDSMSDQTLVSQGIYAEFVDVYLDGVKLVKDVDYTAESGSTRITIRSQTLKASNKSGTHTLGIEFRTQDTDTLKRAAQNYQVEGGNNPDQGGNEGGNNNNGNGGSSSDSGSGSSGNSTNNQVNNGIAGSGTVTGEGDAGNTGSDSSAVDSTMESISYTVQEGDTLWKIAEKYYGSGAYWEKIYQDNSGVISNPDKIYAGQVLVIHLTAISNPMQEQDPNLTYYTVKSGDSLWKIAQQFYGHGWHWRKIFMANDSIPNSKFIYEGQVIIIPDV